MSLVSTISELREWADDYKFDKKSGPTDEDEFLDGIADELSEYAEDMWLIVVGNAKNQKVLDAAIERIRASLVAGDANRQ